MGVSLAARHGRFEIRQNAEINVTPFVDVMLVLLIIFMVALPVATASMKVDLPPAARGDAGRPPVVVTLTLSGALYVGDRLTTLQGLPAAAAEALGTASTAARIHLRADKGVKYGDVIAVMNRLRERGYDKVGLIGEAM